MNELFESIQNANGKIGQNFTPVAKCRDLINKSFLDSFRARLSNDPFVLLALRSEACSIKIFDPAMGNGAILCTALMELTKFVNDIDARLLDVDVAYDASVMPSASQLYGIEIDDQWFYTASLRVLKKNGAHLLCTNSLDVDWVEFTKGNDAYLISNFPFELTKNLNKSDLGKHTVASWHHICDEASFNYGRHCSVAFVVKAHVSGYANFIAICSEITASAVHDICSVSTHYWWSGIGGDADVFVCDYTWGSTNLDRKCPPALHNLHPSIVDHFPTKPGSAIAETWGKPNGRAVDPDFMIETSDNTVILPTLTDKNGVRYRHCSLPYATGSLIITEFTEWHKLLIDSGILYDWVLSTEYTRFPGTFFLHNSVLSFPIADGDDITYLLPMTREERQAELRRRYAIEYEKKYGKKF